MELDFGKHLKCISSCEPLCSIPFKKKLLRLNAHYQVWYIVQAITGDKIPCCLEPLHIQKIQEVCFLASNQCVLGVNHAYLSRMIKHNHYVKQTKNREKRKEKKEHNYQVP